MAYIDNDKIACDRIVKGDISNVLLSGSIAAMQFTFHFFWHKLGYQEQPDDGPAA